MAEPVKVVVNTSSGIPHGTKLTTPEGMPDIVVRARPVWLKILIRVLRVYGYSFSGILIALMGNLAPGTFVQSQDFLNQVATAAGLSVAPAFMQLLTNGLEALAKLDS